MKSLIIILIILFLICILNNKNKKVNKKINKNVNKKVNKNVNKKVNKNVNNKKENNKKKIKPTNIINVSKNNKNIISEDSFLENEDKITNFELDTNKVSRGKIKNNNICSLEKEDTNLKIIKKLDYSKIIGSCKDSVMRKKIPKLVKEIISEYGIYYNTLNNDYVLYYPCSYNNSDKILIQNNFPNYKRLFMLNDCDTITSKSHLYVIFENYLNSNIGSNIIKPIHYFLPKSYLMFREKDINKFCKEFSPKKYYIIKSNKQQQKNIIITNNKDKILSTMKKEYKLILNQEYKECFYKIVQELLPNPLLYKGRKVNIRVYILITCQNKIKNFYYHPRGFVYYTPEKYNHLKPSIKNAVTSGYVPREVYENNPLTYSELFDKYSKSSSILRRNFHEFLEDIRPIILSSICRSDFNKENFKFQLFGLDLFITNNYEFKVMEINKGPSLQIMDEHDKAIKKVIIDVFEKCKIIKFNDSDEHNEFIHV